MGSAGKARWKIPAVFKKRSQNQNHDHHDAVEKTESPAEQPPPPPPPPPSPPKDFLCPISGRLMEDPVILPTGQTFERRCIQACIDLGVDPPGRSPDPPPPSPAPPTSQSLVPNLALRSAILAWCDSNGAARPQPISALFAASLVRPLKYSPLSSVVDAQEEESEPEEVAREKDDVFDSSPSSTAPTPNHPDFHAHNKSAPTILQCSWASTTSSSSLSSSDEFNKRPSCCPPLETEILTMLKSPDVNEQEKGLLLLRTRTRESKEERGVLCTQNILSSLRHFIHSRNPKFQSHAVAAVVNLSLDPINKVPVVRSGAVPPLVSALKSSVPDVRSHAAAAVFSLAVEETSKAAIGALGALQPLLDIITRSAEQEELGTRRDAAFALYHLSTGCSTNRSKLARMGAAKALLGLVKSDQRCEGLGGVALSTARNLAGCTEGRAALMDAGAIEIVTAMIRSFRASGRMKARTEQCVGVLYGLSKGSLRFRGLAKSTGTEEVLVDLLSEEEEEEEEVVAAEEARLAGDGGRTTEMVRAMLKAMSGETDAAVAGYYHLSDDGDDSRSGALTDPAVASRKHRSHFAQTSGVNSSEF